jgi:hypothetical protein
MESTKQSLASEGVTQVVTISGINLTTSEFHHRQYTMYSSDTPAVLRAMQAKTRIEWLMRCLICCWR